MKMECKNQQPPSVIESLMGLNTQPVQKRQRQKVLSEIYLQKAASLHFSPKNLPRETSSSLMQVDITDVVPTVRYNDQCCYDDCQLFWSDSMFASRFQDLQDTLLHPCQLKVMKPLNIPKPENSQDTKISRNVKNSQPKRKQIPLKPTKGRFSVNKYKVQKQDFTSQNANKNIDAPKISGSSIGIRSSNGIRKDGNLCGPGPAKENWIMAHRSLLRPRAHWDTNWYLTSEEPNRSAISKPGLHITECNSSTIPYNVEAVCTSSSKCVEVSCSNGSVIGKCDHSVSDGSSGVYEVLHNSCSCLELDSLMQCKQCLAYQTLKTDGISGFEPSAAAKIECLICDADDVFQETSQSLEETLASCQTPEPLSPTSSESEEVSRCSPNSVLELLSKGGSPSTMDCFMNGSSYLCEVYSEGLGMTVSSDEDNREEPMDTVEDNAEVSDKSYLVSMLSAACGIGGMNYNIWSSFENPITPLVFEILEEKYVRLVSWPRSERKLLFDRINLALTDIAKCCFGIRQTSVSVRQRLCACWTRDEIEEKLWGLLVIHVKEATKANNIIPSKQKKSGAKKRKKSNATTGKGISISPGDSSSLEIEDYMDEVIIDIERSLLDELVSDSL